MFDLHGLPGSGGVLVDAPLAVAIADVAEVRAYFREEIFIAQRRDGSIVVLSRYDYYPPDRGAGGGGDAASVPRGDRLI